MTATLTQDGYQVDAPRTAVAQVIYDATGKVTGIAGRNGLVLVISSAAPNNADGLPDGTVYIQTA